MLPNRIQNLRDGFAFLPMFFCVCVKEILSMPFTFVQVMLNLKLSAKGNVDFSKKCI